MDIFELKKNRKIIWSVRIYANPSVSLFVVVTDVSFQFSRETIYLRVTCLSLFEYCSKWFYDRWQDGINWWPALHYLLDSSIQQRLLKELTNKLGNSQTNDLIWFDFFPFTRRIIIILIKLFHFLYQFTKTW